jgi:flagellar basal-body rod protein FlgG
VYRANSSAIPRQLLPAGVSQAAKRPEKPPFLPHGTNSAETCVAMNVSLYQAAAGLSANARWQELISENLAAAGVPGYRKQELSFDAVQGGIVSQGPAGTNSLPHYLLTSPTTSVNFQQGEVKQTGVSTDVAIEGDGFFGVQLPGGETGYTRDGEFHVNAQEQLVNKSGYLVLSDSGPIQFDSNNPAPISISSTGEVSQGTDAKGKLKVVGFNNVQLLTPVSHDCFLAKDPKLQPTDASSTSTLRQGYIEAANTSPVLEMANLITAMRNFETNQRVVQMQDDRMGKTIIEFGATSGG